MDGKRSLDGRDQNAYTKRELGTDRLYVGGYKLTRILKETRRHKVLLM